VPAASQKGFALAGAWVADPMAAQSVNRGRGVPPPPNTISDAAQSGARYRNVISIVILAVDRSDAV